MVSAIIQWIVALLRVPWRYKWAAIRFSLLHRSRRDEPWH